jgi:hypothetical protein
MEDGSSLGVELGLDDGSEDGFEDDCSDGNEDVSSLGEELGIGEDTIQSDDLILPGLDSSHLTLEYYLHNSSLR